MSIQATSYPIFKPAMRVIVSITNDFPAVVTTSFDHLYMTGLICRLVVPLGFGMVDANGLSGAIVVIDATTFTIDIDTRYFNPFSEPSSFPDNAQYAQSIPFGEVNSTVYLATQNVLPY